MNRATSRPLRLVLASIIATAGLLIASTPAFANGLSLIFPDPASPNGKNVYDLYVWITYPAAVVFIGVEVALLIIIFRFRRKHPAQVGATWHGSTALEITWTIIPTVIIAVIAFLAFQELQRDFSVEAANNHPDMNVAVLGEQFTWSYTYDQGFTVKDQMVVPVGKMVHMTFDSTDVIHSWWVPALTGKTDAVPGYTNQSWIKIEPSILNNCAGNERHVDKATGGCVLHGECAELCGAGHYNMQIDVLALSQDEYDRWLKQQTAKPSPSPSAKPSPSPSPKPSP
jgi:cytochrome c oxidase subunit 2